MSRKHHAFTLVELLVVIGIIALLISILLPALNSARKQATAVQCESNMRQIGQAMLQYANNNNGAIIPAIVWAPGGLNDPWPFLLIQGKYLPDPVLNKNSAPIGNNVLVCPAVRDSLVGTNFSGLSTSNASDGYDRRFSTIILPSGESPNNGASGACIADMGYGLNSCVSLAPSVGGLGSTWFRVPSIAAGWDAADAAQLPPGKKVTMFRHSSDTVILFDGTEWNAMRGPFGASTPLFRISGARHGKWKATAPYTTGVTNILFLDWHVEPTQRKDLPNVNATGQEEYTGDRTQMHNGGVPGYIWNIAQQN